MTSFPAVHPRPPNDLRRKDNVRQRKSDGRTILTRMRLTQVGLNARRLIMALPALMRPSKILLTSPMWPILHAVWKPRRVLAHHTMAIRRFSFVTLYVAYYVHRQRIMNLKMTDTMVYTGGTSHSYKMWGPYQASPTDLWHMPHGGSLYLRLYVRSYRRWISQLPILGCSWWGLCICLNLLITVISYWSIKCGPGTCGHILRFQESDTQNRSSCIFPVCFRMININRVPWWYCK